MIEQPESQRQDNRDQPLRRGPARRRRRVLEGGMMLALGLVLLGGGSIGPAAAASARAAAIAPNKVGGLDCNGLSPVQRPVRADTCTDIRGLANVHNSNTDDGRFYDNGVYIGHDEPDTTFLSSRPGSANNVTWTETLGSDPGSAATVATPGSDVSHWFELSPAPWLSMALCDSNSYPQLPCTAQSDKNAPACPNPANCPNGYPGGGSAFMEMQFYPPGNPPFADSESCDGTHWCAALNIDSLECTLNFAQCNTHCEEPVNFAFIQTNGVPTGPPSPQLADIHTTTPNAHTLLMNPGDQVRVHMLDAPAPGGGSAFEVILDDLTTHKSGHMQASAANGFTSTSIVDCSGTLNNYEPEYSTAKAANIIPWAALATNISTEFETGHFEPCTSVSHSITNPLDPSDTGGTYTTCAGPYETSSDSSSPEVSDELCYQAGDTHTNYAGSGTSTAPTPISGCQANITQNGDLDFDGSPYWTEWPTATSATTTPASFVESFPTTKGQSYGEWFFQTDVALSESSCTGSTGCTVPPTSRAGSFYPYWSLDKAACTLEFGNVSTGVNTFGKDAQYGTNQFARLGYPEFESKPRQVTC